MQKQSKFTVNEDISNNNLTKQENILANKISPQEQRLRWFFVAWLTLSTIINVIDKNTLAVLAPILKNEFNMSNQSFATIINAFLLSYAFMYTIGGRLVDKLGEKISMALFIIWWSISCMLHAIANSALSLGIFRFMLGAGEPGNYPAALRSTTNWFSKSERGLPISIWSTGSSVGNLISQPLIAFITVYLGWRMAFLLPGMFGLIWVLIWVITYRVPSKTLESENISIETDVSNSSASQPKESLIDLLKNSRVRAIVFARLVSDPVWHFYIFWTPSYLAEQWGYNLKDIGFYAWIPFLFGAIGGIFGGTITDKMIRKGMNPVKARKRVLYIAGIIAPIGITVGFAFSAAIALILIAVIAFIVYIWFINTAALVTDAFPKRMVGSVLGLMGTAGTLGGMGLNWYAGYMLDNFHSYVPIFFVAGTGHLLATLILFFFFQNTKTKNDLISI